MPADVHLLVDEARISCTSGMLLCLDREQRLIYILGEIFEVTDTVGAELLEISRENFRQRLARARRELHNFMNDKCGLVNRANPCRCDKKTRGFMRITRVGRWLRHRKLDEQYADIYRQHPFQEPPDIVPALRRLLESPGFRRATDLP